jgi:hypothetical protein
VPRTLHRTPAPLRILLPAVLLLSGVLGARSPGQAANCGNTSVGRIPLTDLGADTYDGYPGGLYPYGLNARPAGHEQSGLNQAFQVTPRDTSGTPDPNGTILFLSIGLSNTSLDWTAFMDSAQVDPLRSPRVRLMDGAVGGWDACQISDPAAGYWPIVDARIRNAGYRPGQVQVVWLMSVCRSDSFATCLPDTFPCDARKGEAQLRGIVRHLHVAFPNLRLVYVSSRNYGGYSAFGNNGESWSYHHGFSVKWLIDDQLAGDPELNWNPALGPVEAPWLSWGPYLWADGLTPRSDGLTWDCADFVSDGVHPSLAGRQKAASRLFEWVHTDPTVLPWYTGATSGVATNEPPPRQNRRTLRASPNPFARSTTISIEGVDSDGVGLTELRVFDVQGRPVRTLRGPANVDGGTVRWDGLRDDGRPAPPGLYLFRGERGDVRLVGRALRIPGN